MIELFVTFLFLLIVLAAIWFGGNALGVPANVLTFLMIMLILIFAILLLTGKVAFAGVW